MLSFHTCYVVEGFIVLSFHMCYVGEGFIARSFHTCYVVEGFIVLSFHTCSVVEGFIVLNFRWDDYVGIDDIDNHPSEYYLNEICVDDSASLWSAGNKKRAGLLQLNVDAC